jgi:hypothetical protein
MTKDRQLQATLARNLRYFMGRETCPYKNPNALGIAAGVSPNTVRNLLDPSRRTTTSTKLEGFPTMDKLVSICDKLGCAVWELLHPDIERSIREREMYQAIESDYQRKIAMASSPGAEREKKLREHLSGKPDSLVREALARTNRPEYVGNEDVSLFRSLLQRYLDEKEDSNRRHTNKPSPKAA